MKTYVLLLSLISLLIGSVASAELVKGELPPGFLEYDIRFTNPVCQTYKYEFPVEAKDGTLLTQKPKSYCTYNNATASNGRSLNDRDYNGDPTLNTKNPQAKLHEWINDPNTKEVFSAYLSFSNEEVRKALCHAVKGEDVFDASRSRGSHLKLTLFMDKLSETTEKNKLVDCVGSELRSQITTMSGGHHTTVPIPKWKDWTIKWAHNKIFIVNPKDINKTKLSDDDVMKIAFSSGNMSTGPFLHHENWHFITVKAKSFFAQAHICAMNAIIAHGMDNENFGGAQYGWAIKDCKDQLEQDHELVEERAIKTFFVPGEGRAASNVVAKEIYNGWAKQVLIAGHQFSLGSMINALEYRLEKNGPAKFDARIILDDDTYNVAHGGTGGDIREGNYLYNAKPLMNMGAKARFMETGHHLHHNKFLIFNNVNPKYSSVFAGAGNLTNQAFTRNMENFYHIQIPGVVDIFNKQYEHLWEMATPEEKLPDPIKTYKLQPLGDWPIPSE